MDDGDGAVPCLILWNFNGVVAWFLQQGLSMRKIVILAGLLMGAALLTGSPAKAELGCTCVKLGSPTVCSSGVSACTFKGGGACVLPCDYQPPKIVKKKMGKKPKKSM